MRLFILAICSLPLSLFAQITVTNVDMSDGGDAVWISTALDPMIDYSTTGPNTTWDYSALTSTGQEQRVYNDMSNVSWLVDFMFGMFAGSGYDATNYTSSTAIPLDQIGGFLPVNITDVFAYSKNSNSSVTSVGFSLSIDGTEVPFKSDTIETRYEFPLNYGDSYISRGYTNLDMNPIYNGVWRQYRQREAVVDGWGTITTPYGTFDALRINHFIEETDSLYMEVLGFGTWIELPIPDSHIYEWWTNGELEPILRITTNVILGIEAVTSIEYKDNEIVGLNEVTESFNVYPNPTVESIYVDGINEPIKYTVLSTQGELVLSGTLSPQDAGINVAELAEGAYSIVLGTSIHTFIKK